MALSDFESWTNIVSLIIGAIGGFSVAKLTIKYNVQWNKLISIFNTGTISQKNKKGDS
jgi:hypothetical protein